MKDAAKKKLLAAGEITLHDYNQWRLNQMAVGKRWEELRDRLASDLANHYEIAKNITNGYRPEVYAMGHNYGTFEIERDTGIDTSYTLYNAEAAERIIREDPQILPPPGKTMTEKLIKGEVKKWEEGMIQSVAMQAILQGEGANTLAKRIARDLCVKDRNAALRYARTAINGAENAGRMNSYKRAAEMGIKVSKQWFATLDDRTRPAHRELDGQIVPLDKPFENSIGKIMFAGDATADGANFWNCRCETVENIAGFERDAKDLSKRNTMHMNQTSYKEWLKAKPVYGKISPRTDIGGNAKNGFSSREKSFSEKINDIVNNAKQSVMGIGTEDIYKVGKIVADEISKTWLEPLRARKKELEEVLDKLGRKEIRSIDKKINKLSSARRGLLSPEEVGFKTIEEVDKEYAKLNERYVKLKFDEKYMEADVNLQNFVKEKMENSREYREHLKSKMSEIREVGYSGLEKEMKTHLNNSRSPVRKSVEEAYSYYPRDWVVYSMQNSKLTPKKVDRGYYSHYMQEIAISGWDKDDQLETSFHELGHRYERVVPKIIDQEKEFYNKRTDGENLEWLGRGYSKKEVTRKDDFLHPYMGKDYGGNAYELVSMGFEYAYTNPFELDRDKDMQAWIYGMLFTL